MSLNPHSDLIMYALTRYSRNFTRFDLIADGLYLSFHFRLLEHNYNSVSPPLVNPPSHGTPQMHLKAREMCHKVVEKAFDGVDEPFPKSRFFLELCLLAYETTSSTSNTQGPMTYTTRARNQCTTLVEVFPLPKQDSPTFCFAQLRYEPRFMTVTQILSQSWLSSITELLADLFQDAMKESKFISYLSAQSSSLIVALVNSCMNPGSLASVIRIVKVGLLSDS